MKLKKLIPIIAIPLTFFSQAALAGDTDAGKAKYLADCESCHFEDDFSGEAVADIAAMIENIVSGEVEHKGELAGLTPQEISDLAAYFASQ
jgi:mono/diheme cytochrome c family protein